LIDPQQGDRLPDAPFANLLVGCPFEHDTLGRSIDRRRGTIVRRITLLLAVALSVVLGPMAPGASAHPPQPYVYSEPQSAEAGTTVTVGGQDFPQGRVEIRWGAVDGALIGETTAPARLKDQSAPFEEVSVTIPEASEGRHYLYAVGYDELGQRVDAYTPFEVVAPPAPAAENEPKQPAQNERTTEEPSAGSPPSAGSNPRVSQNAEQKTQQSVSVDASSVAEVGARPVTVGTSAPSSKKEIHPSRYAIRDLEMLSPSIARPAHAVGSDGVAMSRIARQASDRSAPIWDVAMMLVAAAILLLMRRRALHRQRIVTQLRIRVADGPPMLETVGRTEEWDDPPNDEAHRTAA